MCGRVRLANEWSEIRIKLKFDPDSSAPNIAPSWNIPPTGTLLTAIPLSRRQAGAGEDALRADPALGEGREDGILDLQCPRGIDHREAGVS